MPQLAAHLALLDFQVRDRGVQLGVPVDQALVLVQQLRLVQIDEYLAHRRADAVVEREAFARPIGRGAQAAKLARDSTTRFRLPFPYLLQEFLAPELLARDALFGELAFDHHLRGDARVVGAGLPQRVAPAHAPIADQHVLQGKGQGMPGMQAAGHVRRRHHDRVGLAVRGDVAGERARLLPGRVVPGLDFGRFVGFFQHIGPVPPIGRRKIAAERLKSSRAYGHSLASAGTLKS